MALSQAPTSCLPIYIVDRHGDALQYWQRNHRGGEPPFKVLHIDSHADMHLDWVHETWTEAWDAWKPPPLKSIRKQLSAGVNITNFLPAAIYVRLVDAVVWLRSDFTHGSYNAPAPGHHRRLLGVPDYGQWPNLHNNAWCSRHTSPIQQDSKPLLWDWETLDGSFRIYGPKRAHEGRREVLAHRRRSFNGGVVGAPPLENNTLFEDRPRNLAFGLPPAEGTCVEFAYSVLTRHQLEEGEAAQVRKVLRTDGDGGRWVLDVDLDYYSTLCPSLAIVLRKHSWHSRESSMTFAAWATRLSGIVSGHLERECRQDLFSNDCFQASAQVIFRLGQLPAARAGNLTAADILQLLHRVHPASSPPMDALRMLAETVNGLTPAQRLQWEALDGEDWHRVMQSRCPHYNASVKEVRAEVRRLAPLLAALGPVPPALVTVARSSDGYLPDEIAAVAEWETLLLVRRTWPSSGGCCCVLPPEAESCSEDHRSEVLQGVHFHAEAGSPPLLPRPWPFASEPRPFEHVD